MIWQMSSSASPNQPDPDSLVLFAPGFPDRLGIALAGTFVLLPILPYAHIGVLLGSGGALLLAPAVTVPLDAQVETGVPKDGLGGLVATSARVGAVVILAWPSGGSVATAGGFSGCTRLGVPFYYYYHLKGGLLILH